MDGVILDMDLYGAHVYELRREATDMPGVYVNVRGRRLPRGTQVRHGGRLVHIEGALEGLRWPVVAQPAQVRGVDALREGAPPHREA